MIKRDVRKSYEKSPDPFCPFLPLILFAVGHPRKERSDILCHLRQGRGSPVLIFEDFVVEGRLHANLAAGEVRVVVLAFTDILACRCIHIAREQLEDVVFVTVSCIDNQRQVRGKCAIVGSTPSLLVGVRVFEVV